MKPNLPEKTLIIIAGPTAVGKTATAIKVAQQFKTEIISADSRQFYKEMNVGTAKPSPEELAEVPHHFIDFIPPEEELTAGQFEQMALDKIENVFKKHNTVLCTGGSGLYIKALTEGLDEMPPPAFRERAALNSILNKEGPGPLQEELKEKDPEYYKQVDLNNPHRLIRALEVIRSTGKPFSAFRKGTEKKRPFNILKIALNMDRQKLYDRINHRVDLMIKNGLFQEAETLFPKRHLTSLQTVGYKEIFAFMEGLHDQEEAIRLIKRNTRRYAKRQLTWFRKDKEYRWFEPDDLTGIISCISKNINMDK